jgi:hypothetical protein
VLIDIEKYGPWFEFQIENEIEVEIGIQTKRKNTCGK